MSRGQAVRLKDFEGAWAIDRRVENAVGPDARFAGVARFVPGEGGLVLTEEGEMTVPGLTPMRATRRYLWREAAEGIDVFFDDGRYFHHIGTGSVVEAAHDCAPDVYRVSYDFTGWPRWQAVWQVSGPRKAYRMTSVYAPDRAGD